jgi:hypothetical protein
MLSHVLVRRFLYNFAHVFKLSDSHILLYNHINYTYLEIFPSFTLNLYHINRHF